MEDGKFTGCFHFLLATLNPASDR